MWWRGLRPWRHYECEKCQAPVKLRRKGGHFQNDPDEYEFDGVDLSPEDCKVLADIAFEWSEDVPQWQRWILARLFVSAGVALIFVVVLFIIDAWKLV